MFEVLLEAAPKAGRRRQGCGPQPRQVLQHPAQAGGTAQATALHQDLKTKWGRKKVEKDLAMFGQFWGFSMDLWGEFVGNVHALETENFTQSSSSKSARQQRMFGCHDLGQSKGLHIGSHIESGARGPCHLGKMPGPSIHQPRCVVTLSHSFVSLARWYILLVSVYMSR